MRKIKISVQRSGELQWPQTSPQRTLAKLGHTQLLVVCQMLSPAYTFTNFLTLFLCDLITSRSTCHQAKPTSEFKTISFISNDAKRTVRCQVFLADWFLSGSSPWADWFLSGSSPWAPAIQQSRTTKKSTVHQVVQVELPFLVSFSGFLLSISFFFSLSHLSFFLSFFLLLLLLSFSFPTQNKVKSTQMTF